MQDQALRSPSQRFVVLGVMKFPWWALVAVISSCADAAFQADKLEYIVGGSSADNSDSFLRKWRPILENYLTDSVGSRYEPKIRFKLVLVDYDPNKRAQELAQNGTMDFVCKRAAQPFICSFLIQQRLTYFPCRYTTYTTFLSGICIWLCYDCHSKKRGIEKGNRGIR